ncbi:hypothetical protein B0H13DRAFT_2375391 [Mycena leptocephala]|nr:hypothetical protein B0H13DRAFT_2375391 [Mycena leptocephala]
MASVHVSQQLVAMIRERKSQDASMPAQPIPFHMQVPRSAQGMFTKLYITANPRVFLDTLWIGISALRVFLDARDHAGSEWSMMVSFPKLPFVLRVKREFDASNESLMALTVKSEAMPGALPCRTRSQMEGGRGVLEISDDDEPPQLAPRVRDQRIGTQYRSPDFTSAFNLKQHKDASRSSFPGEFDKSNADESDTDESVTGGLHKSDTTRYELDPPSRGKSRAIISIGPPVMGGPGNLENLIVPFRFRTTSTKNFSNSSPADWTLMNHVH